ncbi:MAG: VWA domain-containing protein [Lachnospiraceae bacterium]|nr:VWA domain-containing protein [Lachnospiraceae bacterium]
MKINPIIPIWIMLLICIVFLFLGKKGKFNYIRQIIVILLLFVINLRPMLEDDNVPTVNQNVDVLFVVDDTISMLAEDYNGNGRRIDAVKEDCRYIAENIPTANFSVISIGNYTDKVIPYTSDINLFYQVIDSLSGQTRIYANGTSFNEAIEVMKKDLDNDRDNYQIVFFISDGEITSDEKLKSYSDLKDYIDDGAVLGYGTASGGPMKTVSYAGDDSEPEYLYYYDKHYNRIQAISKIDEVNLNKIATDMGVGYVHMTKQSDIDNKLDEIKKNVEDLEYGKTGKKGYRDIYYFFVIPLCVLLIFDFIYYRRKFN